MNDPLWIKTTCSDLTRDAIWQYMIDHGWVNKLGLYNFHIEVKDREDFWRRVEYRFNRNYRKRDILLADLKRKCKRKKLRTLQRLGYWMLSNL